MVSFSGNKSIISQDDNLSKIPIQKSKTCLQCEVFRCLPPYCCMDVGSDSSTFYFIFLIKFFLFVNLMQFFKSLQKTTFLMTWTSLNFCWCWHKYFIVKTVKIRIVNVNYFQRPQKCSSFHIMWIYSIWDNMSSRPPWTVDSLCTLYISHIYVLYSDTMHIFIIREHTCTEPHSSHSIMQSCSRPCVDRKEMKPCISCTFWTFLNISLFFGGVGGGSGRAQCWQSLADFPEQNNIY